MIRICPITQQDHAAVGDLLIKCYRWLAAKEQWNETQLEFLLANRASISSIERESQEHPWLIARDTDGVVGVLAVANNEIAKLHVDPTHHRRGIGTSLFRHGEQMIRQAGFDHVFLGSSPTAEPFYEAMGMSVVERRICRAEGFSDHNVTIMRKTLAL